MKFGNVIGDRGNRPRKDVTVTNFSLVLGHACGNRINTHTSRFCTPLSSPFQSRVTQLCYTLCAVSNARSMTSNAIRGIRRKKSSLCEVKVAVIGAPGVGKSGEYYVFITNLAPSHCLLSQIERNVHLFFFFLIKI